MSCDSIQLLIVRGADNIEALVVIDGNRQVVDVSAATRIKLDVGGESFDSDALGDLIWWNDTAEYRGQLQPVIKFRLGNATPLASLADGSHTGGALAIYDAEHPGGYQALTDVEVFIK